MPENGQFKGRRRWQGQGTSNEDRRKTDLWKFPLQPSFKGEKRQG